MAMRDKNNETASQRVARKFFEFSLDRKDCNTIARRDEIEHGVFDCLLYGTTIATLSKNSKMLYVEKSCSNNMTKLTKDRQHALELEAKKRGYTIVHVLRNVTDAQGEKWKTVFVYQTTLADPFVHAGCEVLCWGGYENAIGYK